MNDKALFEQIKSLSLEIRTLIRQGVKEGVDEQVEQRNELLQSWFSGIQELIDMTNDQQAFLEELLKEEKHLLDSLQQEQKKLAAQSRGQKNAKQYLQN